MDRTISPRGLAVVFAGTIFLSAFLLFQVQPLISKTILPWFGGSPAVWTTCMLFFQVLLFGGYLYAHLHEHYLPRKLRGLAHVGLIGLAILALPVSPGDQWKPVDSTEPTWRILALLAATVGLPYFVLSSTGPLIQAWFSRTHVGRSPYRLYSLSNIGSLAALLSYPFLVEPLWDVRTQGSYWSWGFGVFALMCAFAAFIVYSIDRRRSAPLNHPDPSPSNPYQPPTEPLADGSDESIGILRPILWITLPAIASLMLLATTQHVCQDVAVIPFLWVVPFSLYLISFIICFDHARWYWRWFYAATTALLTLVVADLYAWPLRDRLSVTYLQETVIHFALLFSLCMTCHGEVVRLRPHPKYLTGFYLMLSAGGALGGVFVSLIAPFVFSSYVEWKLGLLLSLATAALVPASDRRLWTERGYFVAPLSLALAITGLWAIVYWQFTGGNDYLVQVRNFYGELRVTEDIETESRTLHHGNIVHGTQFTAPERRKTPTTYYHVNTGVGRAINFFQKEGFGVRVGAVGLGTGTLAAYAKPGDRFRFYEINPLVIEIAKEQFSYLGDCDGDVSIELGDARLSLEREAPQRFHVLILDAFSGDAIPTHLLTHEAMQMYLKHLDPDGVIAIHVSNRYLDLTRVVHALARACDLKYLWIHSDYEDDDDGYAADWMLVTRNERLLKALREFAQTKPIPDESGILWTDNYSNLFQIMQKRESED